MDKQCLTKNRQLHIKSIQQFVSNSKEYLHDILCELNWTEEATIFKEGTTRLHTCPQNEEHRVGSDNLQKHLLKCSWHQAGYRDDSVPLPEAGRRFATTVVLDKALQAEVILQAANQDPTLKIGNNLRERDVPQTSDRVFSDFTTDERRVLYDYVVSRTSAAVPRLSEFSLPSGEESKREPLTKEQLMAAERDAKRRRVRYRTAKVHTKSKNYSEVMREVINNQMLAYEDWLREQCGITGPSTSTCLLENTNSEKPVKNNQEMVWLDWDYRTNPHVRWKYLLEQEKRRARKKETGTKDAESSSQDQKRNYKEASTSRRSSQSDEIKKCSYTENQWKHRYRSDLKEKDRESRTNYLNKEHHRDYYKRSDRNDESSKRDRIDYKYYKDNRHHSQVKEERNMYGYDARHGEYQSKREYYKKYKHDDVNALKYNKQHGERDFKDNIKKEYDEYSNCSASLNDYCNDERHKSSEKHKTHEDQAGNTDSDKISDASTNDSYSRKQSKRKKKAKKKHKKKHKSKHKSRHKSCSESSN